MGKEESDGERDEVQLPSCGLGDDVDDTSDFNEWVVTWSWWNQRLASQMLTRRDAVYEEAQRASRRANSLRRRAIKDSSARALRRAAEATATERAAWTRERALPEQCDVLGNPIDPSRFGRRRWVRAWESLAGGYPYDVPPFRDEEHDAGGHDTNWRHSWRGDLLPCDACMDEELWVEQWESHMRLHPRGCRVLADRADFVARHPC